MRWPARPGSPPDDHLTGMGGTSGFPGQDLPFPLFRRTQARRTKVLRYRTWRGRHRRPGMISCPKILGGCMSTEYTDKFSIGRVVSRTFSVIGRNAATFIPVALVILLPMAVMSFITGTPSPTTGMRTSGLLLGLAEGLVNIACIYLLQAALVQATITDLNGQRPSLGNALSAAFGLALPVIVISILTGIGVALGMILLVVPGLMLLCAWCVAVPVRVVEDTGISESFGRSRELTKGHRWPIFGLLLIYGIIAILLGLLAAVVAGISLGDVSQARGNTPYIVIMWLMQVFTAVISGVGVTSLYYELRTVKEGVGPQQLAAAFD